MRKVTLLLDDAVAAFYEQIAVSNRFSLEQVLCDALFRLAGELSLQALRHKNPDNIQN